VDDGGRYRDLTDILVLVIISYSVLPRTRKFFDVKRAY